MKVKKLKSGNIVFELTKEEIVDSACKLGVSIGFYLLCKYLNEEK